MSQLQQWLNPRSSAAKLAVLLVITSVIFYATKQWSIDWVALRPDLVTTKFTLWQLFTYALVFSPSPMSFIFGVLILISIGGALERHWGPKRLWLFCFIVAFVSGALTVLLSLVVRSLGGVPFLGADLITQSVWVAYGLLVGRGQTNFWGLPVTGNTLALIGAAFVLLSGLLGPTWLLVIPELFALALTFVHVRLGFPHDQWVRFNSWRLQRDLNRRSSHLKVISGDQRNTPRDSDKFLH